MDAVLQVGLPLGVVIAMFSLGLGLTVADFARVFSQPRAFLTGAFCQLILLPVAVFVVTLLFGLTGMLAVGMMILAACPGGATSNVVSRVAKGDVALSVSLTAVISVLSIVTVPLIISFALARFMASDPPAFSVAATSLTMAGLVVVPVAIGMVLRVLAPGPVARIEPGLANVATGIVALIILVAIVGTWPIFVANFATLGPALFLLAVLLAGAGLVLPYLVGCQLKEAKTIAIETGLQNGTLGIAVAGLLLPGEGALTAFALPSAGYGVFMYLVVLPSLIWLRRIG